VVWVALAVFACAAVALAWYLLAGPGARRASAASATTAEASPAAPAPPPAVALAQPARVAATAPGAAKEPDPADVKPAPAAAEGVASDAPAVPAPVTVEPAAAPAPRNEEADYKRLLATAERKYDQGRFDDAVADYKRAAVIHPGAPVQVGLARAYYDASRNADALRALDLALQQDREYAPAWLLLGELHQAARRIPEARTAYQQFLALQPRGEQARAVREILSKQLK
jgi:tetratricopeptide (TPR) repeat protein